MARFGWTFEEEELLGSTVDSVRSEGGSLSEAFRQTAVKTGRKPNSVRNHYYSSPERGGEAMGYVPFSDEESRDLAERMLLLIEEGCSVRRSAQILAGGDAGLMLRYQNKFRSLCEKKPGMIEAIIKEKHIKRRIPERKSPETDHVCKLKRELEEKKKEIELQRRRISVLQRMFDRICAMEENK